LPLAKSKQKLPIVLNRNLKWQNIDFEREVIHLKQAKGEKERIVFLHKCSDLLIKR